jgi:hypothetical protein
MGVLGFLGKVGKGALGLATGGLSNVAFDAIGGGLGKASQAQASNRGTKAELMLDQNSALERELIARQQEKRSARDNAYTNAIRGSMAYNWKPTEGPPGINVVRFGGGAIGNPQARAAGDELLKQSMNRLTQPDLTVDGGGSMPTYRNLAQDREFQQTLNPGIMERIFGVGSALLPFSPLVRQLMDRTKPGPVAGPVYEE